MGLFRNWVHSLWIVLGLYALATGFNLTGIDVFLDTLFTPMGAIVASLLAFMETTYTRF